MTSFRLHREPATSGACGRLLTPARPGLTCRDHQNELAASSRPIRCVYRARMQLQVDFSTLRLLQSLAILVDGGQSSNDTVTQSPQVTVGPCENVGVEEFVARRGGVKTYKRSRSAHSESKSGRHGTYIGRVENRPRAADPSSTCRRFSAAYSPSLSYCVAHAA